MIDDDDKTTGIEKRGQALVAACEAGERAKAQGKTADDNPYIMQAMRNAWDCGFGD